jgi:methylenetetrahydrofolate dehydrogenase (NADP+)/methenyltetrahydrofolate cyclohydrolase
MQILDGKLASAAILESLKNEVLSSSAQFGRVPQLCAIIAGNNPASESYLNSKTKACTATGIISSIVRLDAEVSENEFIQCIEKVNKDQSIDGLLIQFPLPAHFNESKIINAIDPSKDVDGLHPVNAGKLALGLPTFVPATPLGIMLLL